MHYICWWWWAVWILPLDGIWQHTDSSHVPDFLVLAPHFESPHFPISGSTWSESAHELLLILCQRSRKHFAELLVCIINCCTWPSKSGHPALAIELLHLPAGVIMSYPLKCSHHFCLPHTGTRAGVVAERDRTRSSLPRYTQRAVMHALLQHLGATSSKGYHLVGSAQRSWNFDLSYTITSDNLMLSLRMARCLTAHQYSGNPEYLPAKMLGIEIEICLSSIWPLVTPHRDRHKSITCCFLSWIYPTPRWAY